MATLLIIGATGLVGGNVLQRALADARIDRIVAPTRRPLPAHDKLQNPVIELAGPLPDADWWAVDGVICAIGTTQAKAGSAEAFRAVDFAIPLAIARKAREAGARSYNLTSAMGANAASRLLYLRTKGELEDALRSLGFPSLSILRPGFLDGDRGEFRPLEHVASIALRIAAPILPPRFRISRADIVADVLLESFVTALPGEHVIEADRFSR